MQINHNITSPIWLDINMYIDGMKPNYVFNANVLIESFTDSLMAKQNVSKWWKFKLRTEKFRQVLK